MSKEQDTDSKPKSRSRRSREPEIQTAPSAHSQAPVPAPPDTVSDIAATSEFTPPPYSPPPEPPTHFNEPSSPPTNTGQDEQNVYTDCHGVTTTFLESTSVRDVSKITTGFHHVVGDG